MRCKKHIADASSTLGVCATCLRERLSAHIITEAQARIRIQTQTRTRIQTNYKQEDQWKSDTIPQPLPFPSSVSPYISRAKSDWQIQQRFYSTPQVGPTITDATSSYKKKKKNHFTFSFLSGLFRSKSKNPDPDPNPRVSNPQNQFPSSPSWFSGRRKKQTRTFSLDDIEMYEPGRGSDYKPAHNRSFSGMGICLSPLVRKGTAAPLKHHHQVANTTSFCKNRSRKLVDFGRFNSHR